MISLFLGPPEMSGVLLVNYNRVARVRINVSSYTIVAKDGPLRSVRCCVEHTNSVTVDKPNTRCTTNCRYFESPFPSSTVICAQS